MSQQPVPKKTFSGVLSKFDTVAQKTTKSGIVLAEHFKGYVTLNRPDNYSSVRNELKSFSESVEKYPFIKRFTIKPTTQSRWANHLSRYLGGTTALICLGLVKKTIQHPIKAGIGIGALMYLAKTKYGAPMAFMLGEAGFSAKVIGLAPVFTAGLTLAVGLTAFASWQVHRIRQAGKFEERKQSITDELTHLVASEGVASTPKLDKLVKAFEKSFKPDFSPQQTQAIRDALAVQRSESGIAAAFTPSQAESLRKITDTLTKQYFVPVYLATNAGLHMIVEMDGNEKAVMAKLKSRNIEEDWVNRFKMEPLATVEGSCKNGKVVDEQSPSP